MKPNNISKKMPQLMITVFLILISSAQLFAQKNVEVNGNDVGTWFSNNWMWVTGAILFLLLLLLFSGSTKKTKTTTIVKDNMGDTKRIITTEKTS